MPASSVTGTGPGDSGKRVAYLSRNLSANQFVETTVNPQDLGTTTVPTDDDSGTGSTVLSVTDFNSQFRGGNTVMGGINALRLTVEAGKAYAGLLNLIAYNTVGGDGLKIDFNGGLATLDNSNIAFGVVGTPVGSTPGVTTVSTTSGQVTFTTVSTSPQIYQVFIAVNVLASGTIIPEFGLNSSSTGLAHVVAGSSFYLTETTLL